MATLAIHQTLTNEWKLMGVLHWAELACMSYLRADIYEICEKHSELRASSCEQAVART